MQNTSSWNISNWFYCFQKYFRKRDKNDRRHEKSSFMVNFMSFTNFFAADEIRCDHRFSLLLLRRFCGHIHKSRSTIQKTVFLLNECPVNMQTEDFSFFFINGIPKVTTDVAASQITKSLALNSFLLFTTQRKWSKALLPQDHFSTCQFLPWIFLKMLETHTQREREMEKKHRNLFDEYL